jgi:hypothetical protein
MVHKQGALTGQSQLQIQIDSSDVLNPAQAAPTLLLGCLVILCISSSQPILVGHKASIAKRLGLQPMLGLIHAVR